MYGFPFTPYSVQQELMDDVTSLLDEGGIGFFESPTGTGKTLSLLCALLSWLESKKHDVPDYLLTPSSSILNSLPSWVMSQSQRSRDSESAAIRQRLNDRIQTFKDALLRFNLDKNNSKKITSSIAKFADTGVGDSDTEEVQPNSNDNDYDDEVLIKHRVFYLSRTHSQLKQVVNEFKTTKFSSVFRSSILGSRKLCCPIQSVRESMDPTFQCRKLRDSGGCTHGARERVNALTGRIVDGVVDIEEVRRMGDEMGGCCPYFSVRLASRNSSILFAPFQMLFSDPELMNIENSIIVLDEGHNVTSALESFISAEISSKLLKIASEQIIQYLHLYSSRLLPNNLRNCRKLSRVINLLINHLASTENTCCLSGVEFLAHLDVDNINFIPLVNWAKRFRLGPKLSKLLDQEVEQNAIIPFVSILIALSQPDDVIKVIYSKEQLKVSVIDPSFVLEPLVQKAHAIIVASGTLTPVNTIKSLMFPNFRGNFCFRSYKHLIPQSAFLPLLCSKGPSGISLKFTYSSRQDSKHSEEFLSVLVNLFNILPFGGLVVFFSSKDAMNSFHGYCKSFSSSFILNVMLEPNNADFDEFFSTYRAKCISSKVVLFSVLGGRLSEGINFSDNLARIVVIAGLPLPNPTDLEAKAKVELMRNRFGSQFASNFWISNAMRLVNQAAGRVVRHASDYGVVVFADVRFNEYQHIISTWIKELLVECPSFQDVGFRVGSFFSPFTKPKCLPRLRH
ncbi:hypothetical protein P9112_002630 [Eukaryota sp. TZLM1-RC]